MNSAEFTGLEYQRDGGFAPVRMRIEGSEEEGFQIFRNEQPQLEVGPGYRLLSTLDCGICGTDLDRRYLPFELPQITGHEVVVADESGRRYVVEINASHRARGIDGDCRFCNSNLHKHCPSRLVLGIDRLPGGFGPYLLAPRHALVELPDAVQTDVATLIEPFAAALHAVQTILPRRNESVAVLGPRRLGLLVVAALSAYRLDTAIPFEIVAISRHKRLLSIAKDLGADRLDLLPNTEQSPGSPKYDCVVDTTGSPHGLELAIQLARREVHLKSTHGREACGLSHLTQLVVDELSIEPFDSERVASIVDGLSLVDEFVEPGSTAGWSRQTACDRHSLDTRFGGVLVNSAKQADYAIRPRAGSESSLLLPRGKLIVHPKAHCDDSPLISSIVRRHLSLTSSRCGDFRSALGLLNRTAYFEQLRHSMITHRFAPNSLIEAFAIARTEDCIKAVVVHDRSFRRHAS